MKRTSLRVASSPLCAALCAVLCAACTPTPAGEAPPKAPLPKVAPSVAPPPPPSPLVSVRAPEVMPASPAVDGDLTEWGALAPPAPAGPGAAADPAREAPSRLSFALTKDGAFVAATLAEASKDGVWLTVSFQPAEVMLIGYLDAGGVVQNELECETHPWTGAALTPAEAATCQASIEKHAAFLEAHEARFTRVYRLDREGIRLFGADGALHVIDGAKAASAPSEAGTNVEVSLPLAALPRVAEAPVQSVMLHATAATAARPPSVPAEAKVTVGVPAPVHFEPHAEMREKAFFAVQTRSIRRLALSYHPATPDELEVVDYPADSNGFAVEARSQVLYRPAKTVGDLEIGYLYTLGTSVATSRGGKLIDVAEIRGESMGVAARGGETLVFAYTQAISMPTGYMDAGWSVVAVRPDGVMREAIQADFGLFPQWQEVEETHAPGFERIGLRGLLRDPTTGDIRKPVEVTWKYDPKSKTYRPSVRTLPRWSPKRP